MVAIPSKGYVILLVNHSQHNQDLYPEQFDDVLESIARHECLGNIQDGLLFDEGFFVGFYLKKIYVEGTNPMGSVLLIDKNDLFADF